MYQTLFYDFTYFYLIFYLQKRLLARAISTFPRNTLVSPDENMSIAASIADRTPPLQFHQKVVLWTITNG